LKQVDHNYSNSINIPTFAFGLCMVATGIPDNFWQLLLKKIAKMLVTQ
jgi:hypothetical protein